MATQEGVPEVLSRQTTAKDGAPRIGRTTAEGGVQGRGLVLEVPTSFVEEPLERDWTLQAKVQVEFLLPLIGS